MANPNYPPNMPPMGGPPMGGPMGGPPMGGPPMGGPPMGGPPVGAAPMPPRPMRRGTSKAVPVVVSAGLAVGVFCGLLFGVGTGKKEAVAAPAKGNNLKAPPEEPKPDPGAAPKGLGATAAAPVQTGSAAPAAGSAAPAAGSAAPTVAAPAAGSAAPAVEEKKIKLSIVVKPEGAAKEAKITVDGKEIEGTVIELPGDQKSVKVEVKASGYRSGEKKIDLVGDEMSLEMELQKRSGGGGVRPPRRPDRPPGGGGSTGGGGGGGGLIDI